MKNETFRFLVPQNGVPLDTPGPQDRRLVSGWVRRGVRVCVLTLDAAFIGLVVALSVLIVVCCVAVFYLLRHYEPTEQERVARRERYRRTREREHGQAMSSTNDPPPTGLGSFGGRVKQLWQSTTGRGRGGGERGWVRAGSDDGWASRSDHEHEANVEVGLASPPVVHVHSRPGPNRVRVVESPSSDTASGFVYAPYAQAYTDPFSKAHGVVRPQSSQSPPLSLSPAASSPRGSASVDEHHQARGRSPASASGDGSGEEEDRQDRHRSTMSNASVWTHGSKFVEDI